MDTANDITAYILENVHIKSILKQLKNIDHFLWFYT